MTIQAGIGVGSQPPLDNLPTSRSTPQYAYIVVFGYPQDKYSLTVEYFQSLGESTSADPHLEIVNCFRIGYKNPSDAMRAVRRNGETLGGCWMVGAKWAVSVLDKPAPTCP
jgi:nuclear pore complex protein Nup53